MPYCLAWALAMRAGLMRGRGRGEAQRQLSSHAATWGYSMLGSFTRP
ncbi:MAG TPA: hypothetical protein VGX76_18105 [Pirellulales bacterium]|nr:hypothetical protein [Pirellulales bacterium]